MKALVVGTGSIGRRHIANLLKLGAHVSAFSYRGAALSEGLGGSIELVESWQEAIAGDCDAVVVANSTDLHMEVALSAARAGKHMFLEKPLSLSLAGTQELGQLIQEKGLIVEVGFMMRMHPNLVWMHAFLAKGDLGEVMHVRAAVGQWLPDWRPGTDHREGYGAFRAKGGGVIFDLIHEIDLVNWLAGPVVDVTAMVRYVPQLQIQTEAIAQIGLGLASGALAQVHLDYVRPGYGRTLEIVGEKGVLSWDFVKGIVWLERANTGPDIVHQTTADFERNAMFLTHMERFLSRMVSPTVPALASYQEGVNALRVALACHRAAIERRQIRPEEIDTGWEMKEVSL